MLSMMSISPHGGPVAIVESVAQHPEGGPHAGAARNFDANFYAAARAGGEESLRFDAG